MSLAKYHGGAISHSTVHQRGEDRITTIFRPVLIETDDFAGFCLVRNLSSGGLNGQVYTEFVEGTPITLDFGRQNIVSGKVKWCQDGHVGVEFEMKIDVDEILSIMASKIVEGKATRAPRLEIRCEGELRIGDKSVSMELQDISQRGLKVRASVVQPGDEVFVQLEGLSRRKAVVRWIQGGTAGLNFIAPLPLSELAHWVVWRQFDRLQRPECERGPLNLQQTSSAIDKRA